MIPNFEFRKFKPNLDVALFANAMLLQVLDHVPYGSLAAAALVKEDNRFLCFLEVQTNDDTILEHSMSHDPKTAVRLAGERMKDRMQEWKVEHLTVDAPTFWDFKEIGPRG
jgi:hypothetical protein